VRFSAAAAAAPPIAAIIDQAAVRPELPELSAAEAQALGVMDVRARLEYAGGSYAPPRLDVLVP